MKPAPEPDPVVPPEPIPAEESLILLQVPAAVPEKVEIEKNWTGSVVANPAETSSSETPRYKWYHKLAGLFAVIFCFELGVFLLVFPWASDWDLSYFSSLPLWASGVWASPYFRGAISGLGVLNIYVSFVEVFRLRRFSASSSSLS